MNDKELRVFPPLTTDETSDDIGIPGLVQRLGIHGSYVGHLLTYLLLYLLPYSLTDHTRVQGWTDDGTSRRDPGPDVLGTDRKEEKDLYPGEGWLVCEVVGRGVRSVGLAVGGRVPGSCF